MKEGRVKMYIEEKGFGYITYGYGTYEYGQDIFFHFSEIVGDVKTLKEGDKVTFEITQTSRGTSASKVRLI